MKKNNSHSRRLFLPYHYVAIFLLAVIATGCTKPPVELSASLIYSVPKEVNADELGDLDWYMITSDDLEAAQVIAFDQRSGADYIQRVSAAVSGDKSLVYAGVTQYRWEHGQRLPRLSDIAPGLDIQGKDEGSRGEFLIDVQLPKMARRIIIHGSCWQGKPAIDAQIGEVSTRTEIDCSVEDFPLWTYELTFRNAENKTARISVKSTIEPKFSSSLTISGALLSSRDAGVN